MNIDFQKVDEGYNQKLNELYEMGVDHGKRYHRFDIVLGFAAGVGFTTMIIGFFLL